ncbi:MAG: 23S rRNA (uracil(1939)-C(5))-methyltransferase RlmD [Bacteroidota bacterium]
MSSSATKPLRRSGPPASADQAIATVVSLSHDGRGVARLDGKTVFIEGALPGERVRFRYFNKYKNYDSGGLVDILEASPDRVTPPCPHFGVCGGCDLQHLRAELQIQAKQRIVAEQLAHLGKVEPQNWLAPITGPALDYRRRARLGVRHVPSQGGVVIGFRERRRSFIANLDTCPVLDPKIVALLPALRAVIGALSRPDRIPQIEVAVGDADFALVFRHLVPFQDRDREQLRAFGERHGAQIYTQRGGPDSALILWPSEPRGLYYRLPEFDVDIRFQPTDFVQINSAVNRAMVSQAVRLLEPKSNEQVLDLFCGLGNFTLPLARHAGQVLGVEADGDLVQRARQNAQRHGMANVEFRSADLYQETTPASWGEFRPDKLLLDPPRSGAMEAIKALVEPLPSRIVYVSCYPATLARDSQYLVHVSGYRLEAAGVMDMFPQTSHVETMALFVRP